MTTFKARSDCLLRGVKGQEARPGYFYCVICGFSAATKEETLQHMQYQHSRALLQRFGVELLARPLEELAEDNLDCLAERGFQFSARCIEEHTCGEAICGNLHQRLIDCLKYFEKRDACNWVKLPEGKDLDPETLREYRILTATLALRLDCVEKERPEIFGYEPSN